MTFFVYQDSEGAWWWSLTTGSGWAVAVSSESYISRTDCLFAVNLVMGAGHAAVRVEEPAPRAEAPRRAA